MSFILGQLRQIGMVAIIMVCATGGTVGFLKLIKHFTSGKDFPKGPLAPKLEEDGKQNK